MAFVYFFIFINLYAINAVISSDTAILTHIPFILNNFAKSINIIGKTKIYLNAPIKFEYFGISIAW